MASALVFWYASSPYPIVSVYLHPSSAPSPSLAHLLNSRTPFHIRCFVVRRRYASCYPCFLCQICLKLMNLADCLRCATVRFGYITAPKKPLTLTPPDGVETERWSTTPVRSKIWSISLAACPHRRHNEHLPSSRCLAATHPKAR